MAIKEWSTGSYDLVCRKLAALKAGILCHICSNCTNVGKVLESFRAERMSRISIDVSDLEHKKLKAMAALRGQSIKDYVLERALGGDEAETSALKELEQLLDARIRAAQAGAVSRRTVSEVFTEVVRKKAR